MENERDLACAIALGDCARAAEIIDLMVRDEALDLHLVGLGRSDAAIETRRRQAKAPLKRAA